MRIFLAAPLTSKIDSRSNCIDFEYRLWLEKIIEFLNQRGHNVISAHAEECWGDNLRPPLSALEKDYEEIKKCDIIVAYIGEPPSPGVQMELGFAYSFGKKMIILIDVESNVPYLTQGLVKKYPSGVITFKDMKELLSKLGKLL